jgi:organic radical activating enzyme
VQGEGRFTGYNAAFLRFSGCNLHCSFCDTQHDEGEVLSCNQILERFARMKFPESHSRIVILTGGEPLLQLDLNLLLALQSVFSHVHIETNGTIPFSDAILNRITVGNAVYVTCSPKIGQAIEIQRIDELKYVVPGDSEGWSVDAIQAQVRSLWQRLAIRAGAPVYIMPQDNRDGSDDTMLQALKIHEAMPFSILGVQAHKVWKIR